MLLGTMAGCPELAAFADEAARADDAFGGAFDDEVLGVLCAWDRVEAHAAARKTAAVAELIRRRRLPGAWPGAAGMPAVRDEFTGNELGAVLGGSRSGRGSVLGLAPDLEVKLPGTRAAFRDGIVSQEKAEIIARAIAVLDPAEARAAEALVLGRAGRLTPAGLRSAIARAVIAVAPEKARERREQAERDARVERWAEESGNAALAGRELPPAQVLAADQKITSWARQLKKAGLPGSMDELRARAYLDLLLGTDSRPRRGPGGGGTGAGSGPAAGRRAAGRVRREDHLTIPLATLLGLAERPGEIPGLGPVDPAPGPRPGLRRRRQPGTTWCVTVTDQDGHAIGHGCARPEPRAGQAPGETRPAQAADGRGSPSPPGQPGRPADTAPGGCTPGPADGRTSWSPSTRSPPTSVTTGTRPAVMIPASSSGT